MKLIEDFLSYFQSLDIQFWVDGEQLHYNAPEGMLTPTLKSQLRERKSEIIEFLQKADFASNFDIKPILPVPRDIALPLSFAQQRLWFLQQLEPNNPFYNLHGAIQLIGSLNIMALEQSLNRIIERHEALRTTFEMVEGQPVQIVVPSLTLTLPIVNLYQLPETQQQLEVQRIATEQSQRLFDLAQGPLLRFTLLQLGQQKYVLLFIRHHIVSDGWSMGVLMRELSALYQAFSTGKLSPLPELPIQYADFAVWQRQELQGGKLSSQLSYWKQQLENAPPLLQLPTDRPRPLAQTCRGARQSFLFPKSLTETLKAIGKEAKATLFMTLLAAFKILLYRYSGQEDIIVGSPIANRNRAEIEGLIGFFVNTLVLRTDVSGNPTFEELLGRVRQVTMGAYEHQDLPFEKLVDELQPERDANYNPLFQVLFGLQITPRKNFQLPGLTLTPVEVERTSALLDLCLDMTETDSGLVGCWEYNIDLFDAATISRMSGHFQTLLEAIVENPKQRVDQLPLLTEAQQHQLLVQWNETENEYLRDQCIHQLFEEQVERTPDAVAVVFENQQLTYRQLNQKANQLAQHLQSLGVKPEVLVGICVERSLEMVVGLLGILKAGGAYVPLDPNYPQERLSYMLADSGVEVLLTQQSLLVSLPEHQARVLCLDTDWEVIKQHSQENLDAGVSSDNLAYVIYTSGSTGVPKGVAMNQATLVNLILWQLQKSSAKYGTKTGQFSPISFDVSFQEILSTWCSGGTLVLMPEYARRDGTALLQLLTQQSVERLFLPFVALEQLAQTTLNTQFIPSNLCELITAGEQLQITPTLVNFLDKLSNCRLENQYGPTETHVVTAFTLKGILNNWPTLPPIGRPIANTQIYILDNHLQTVPIGVSGELYIGGDSLARGYLNRPELTQEKFIPNPFSHSKSERLYKTGDLARYLPDGNIEFLGRIDHQAKIRGFRIELGEIEAILNKHPEVSQSVVMLYGSEAWEKRLIAYVVLVREQTITSEQLREFLKLKLPEYMLPSAFIFLDTLPLTPNGKVNRLALPAPNKTLLNSGRAFVPPQTPAEEVLIEIWQDILSLERIGIHDNFFELGGHSLLAMQLVNHIQQRFSLELPVRLVFQSQTVAQLVETLAQIAGDRNVIEKIARTWQEVAALSSDQVQSMLTQLRQ